MPDKAEHPEKKHIRQRIMSLSVVIARLAIGGLFVYSGFVKAVDIWGVDYKIEDYLEAFGWIWLAPLSGFIAAALPIFEFVAGLLLAIGSFRRGTVIMLLGCMAVMLPLTAYIAIANPVADCGCFGDAWVISNHASFWKNMAIIAGLIFLLRNNTLVRSLYGPAVQWLTAVIPALSLIPVITYGNIVQPMIDFRPYKIGASLTETREKDGTSPDFVFKYTKDGKEQEFTIDNLPDSSWTFVDRRQIAARQPNTAADKPSTDPIAIFDEDISIDDLISHDGESLLLLIPDIEEIDALTNFQLNDLNDLATRQGIPLICLTSSTEEHIVKWRDISMSDYPVYRMDDSQLKTIARGNPAIVYTDSGIIRYKSTFGAFQGRLPEITDNSGCHLAALSGDADDARHYLVSFMLAMLAMMGTLLLLNRTPLLIKFGIRLRKNQNKKVPSREDQTFQILNISKMRKNIVAGNWKMNTILQEGVKLATDVNEALKARKPNCDVVICVPFTHLTSVNAVIDNTKLGLGAENCADKEKGAYTGEVSAAMVASTGAKYVILGHSERRQYYHETSETLKEKVTLALANGLTPIFCIGEVLEERENGTYFDVVKKQVEDALFSLSADDFKKLILAYEPVWAIGTGKTATADQAEEIHEFIRKTIASKYGDEVAESTSILYGGSCKPSNAKELFSKPDVDGGLIGGAALDAVSFMGIVDAF